MGEEAVNCHYDHKNMYESEDINDQDSENDNKEKDEQNSTHEDKTEYSAPYNSAQYNETQCIKCASRVSVHEPIIRGNVHFDALW